jgi:hypothetical protein
MISDEVQDTYDPCSVTIHLIKGTTLTSIDGFADLEDSNRVLVDCLVKTYKE